ncbi:MAG: hypothetical protein WC438_03735 [Candidatus Pacearchaeota archaeon]
MEIINTTNLNEARKQIQKLKKENRTIIVKAQDYEFNRKLLENKDINMLLSPEMHNRKNKLKQRDSGLNEVLCKLAKQNNIQIAINLNEITKLPKKEKAEVLARIIQNINLCKRTGTKIIILNKKSKQDIMSLFLSLTASTSQAKQAFFN